MGYVLLSKDLYSMFGRAGVGFLKVCPELDTYVSLSLMCAVSRLRISRWYPPIFYWLSKILFHTTRRHYSICINPPMGLYCVPPTDIQADWSHDEVPLPPSILLDFMYGAAIIKHWRSNRLGNMLKIQFEADFSKVLAEKNQKSLSPEEDEPEDDIDDSKDPEWLPPGSRKGKQKGSKMFSSDMSAGLLEAMDQVLLLSILLKGTI